MNANKNLRSRLVNQPNSNKNSKYFQSSVQEDLVPIIFGDLIPKKKICKNNSQNMNIYKMTHIVPQGT